MYLLSNQNILGISRGLFRTTSSQRRAQIFQRKTFFPLKLFLLLMNIVSNQIFFIFPFSLPHYLLSDLISPEKRRSRWDRNLELLNIKKCSHGHKFFLVFPTRLLNWCESVEELPEYLGNILYTIKMINFIKYHNYIFHNSIDAYIPVKNT